MARPDGFDKAHYYEGAVGVRFVGIMFLLVLAVLIGLFAYGQMMEPDVHEIQVEANHAAE